jgi:hypothetical protein
LFKIYLSAAYFSPVISLMLDFLLLTMIQLVKKVCSAFRVSATCSRARSA